MNHSDATHHGGKYGRLTVWTFLALLALALLRIVSTYSVFNETFDEPAHIAAGMEWLDHGTYAYETKHPPLRAVYAVGPRLLGRHYSGKTEMLDEGHQILYGDGHYWRNLTAARVAALPFFAITVLLVFVWARRLGGALAGVLATLAYSTLPLALGHAAVAANDTLLTATLTLALFVWAEWLSKPTYLRATLFGCTAAIALYAKLSAIPFLGVVVAASGILWLLRVRAAGQSAAPEKFIGRLRYAMSTTIVAGAAFGMLLWAGYRFSVEPLTSAASRPHEQLDQRLGTDGLLHDLSYAIAETPLPAPDFFRGFQAMLADNAKGRTTYFMGEVGVGSSAFFPVGILIKTPIAFLLLMMAGVMVLLYRARHLDAPLALIPPLGAALIVLIGVRSNINIGVRHMLPVFPLLAVCVGAAAAAMWRASFIKSPLWRIASRTVITLLISWQMLVGVRAHPDYLAYFNECCSADPQKWLVDSDLDWGQDLVRLSKELRSRGIDMVHLVYHGTADIYRHDLPSPTQLEPYQRVHGWVAASEYSLAMGTADPPYDQYRWLLEYRPVARIGKSIRLYWIPEDTRPADSAATNRSLTNARVL